MMSPMRHKGFVKPMMVSGDKTPYSPRCLVSAFPKWRSWVYLYYYRVLLFIILIMPCPNYASDSSATRSTTYAAIVNVTIKDNKNEWSTLTQELGHFGTTTKIAAESGQVIHVWTKANKTDGCTEIVNVPPHGRKWIALIKRGNCEFKDKILMAAKENASAVVIYDRPTEKSSNNQGPKGGGVKDVVAIYISNENGESIIRNLEKGYAVFMQISVGKPIISNAGEQPFNPHNISKTSVLFVSISFIVLMIISLAWLVFYYIQRFRYAHAKERLTRRLASAAKKAIAKIPQRTVKSGDKELESEFDQCAVCIEGYRASEVIRILPCKHIFHKSCVDPWLLDQRSCPMCKLDILREYGMQVHLNSSQESVHAEVESGATASAIADEVEHLPSSSEEHGAGESMNIVLIQHENVQYHGSDTFSGKDDINSESTALNPCKLPSQTCVTADIEIESDEHNSDTECNELHSLMTGRRSSRSSKRDSLEA